jgi:hypothetical protein
MLPDAMDASEALPPRPHRKLRWPLALGVAFCLVLGARLYARRGATHASETAARAFTQDLFAGNTRRAWDGTTRKFQSRNEVSKFEAEFAHAPRPVEVSFEERRAQGDRITFYGRARVDGEPTAVTVVVVEEGGAFRIDGFSVGSHVGR